VCSRCLKKSLLPLLTQLPDVLSGLQVGMGMMIPSGLRLPVEGKLPKKPSKPNKSKTKARR
jgi:hypothetical protein